MRIFGNFNRAPEDGTGAAPAPVASEAPAVSDAAVETAAAAAPHEAVAASIPAVEAPASGETKSDPSLLGGQDAPVTPEGEPAKDAPVEAQPTAPPTYEIKAPDGFTLDEAATKEFADLFGASAVAPDKAQGLIDRHFAELKRVQESAAQNQREVWKQYNDNWKSEFRKDPELGGANEATTLQLAKTAIQELGGTREQAAELLRHVENNGMANYVGFIRLLHNAAKRLNLFEDGMIAPPPQVGAPRRGTPGSGQTGWYPNS